LTEASNGHRNGSHQSSFGAVPSVTCILFTALSSTSHGVRFKAMRR
jgi:hypothetical protein